MSNKLGEIYGTVKDGKGSITINSNTIDICGNLLMNGLISLCSSNEEVASADPSGILNRINSLDNNVNILDNSVNILNNSVNILDNSVNILDNSVNILDNSVNILDNSVNILLTSNNDASFNNVDVSGTLNVQGEKVMTVPSLDICGNDLSANTTYEITTGPTGSINNISFVKKQESYYLSARSGSRSLDGAHNTIINWTIDTESAGASSLNTSSGVWTCPATGVYWVYYQPYYTGTRFHQTDTRLMVSGTAANIYRFTPYRSDGDGADQYVDDIGDVAIPISIMRPLSAGTTVYLTMRVVSFHNMYGLATLYIQRIN